MIVMEQGGSIIETRNCWLQTVSQVSYRPLPFVRGGGGVMLSETSPKLQ